ncbi:MAG: MFS transporter [Spirochaetales bacterium]|nr:MFS transporter [Spirochaetales bacterium]
MRRFATLNGVSVALLLDSMLILYAIRNGLGDAAVATLASFMHLTMPFMVLGKVSIARHGAARTWGTGWLLRSVSAAIMIAAPFVPGAAPQAIRTAIILAGGFGFAAFRAIGLVGNSPVIGEITTADDRGRFLSGNWARATMTQMITLTTVILLLRRDSSTAVFQAMIAVGAAIGIYVGIVLNRVPESDVPRESASLPLRDTVRRVWRVVRMRKLLFAWIASFASFTLVIPFAVITLKNGYGVSDYQALGFTLLTLLGGMTASLVNGAIADEVGPRPLLIIYVATLMGIAAYWAFAADTLAIGPTIAAFFLAGYCKFGILSAANHYFLNVTSGSDRVGSAIILRTATGATTGLIGSVFGGGILTILANTGFVGMDIYRTYFRIAVGVVAAAVVVVSRLDRLGDWSVVRAALLLFRPKRILAIRSAVSGCRRGQKGREKEWRKGDAE